MGKNDGHLTAMNSATGKRLWDFQTGAGMNAPPSVFEYERGSMSSVTPRAMSLRVPLAATAFGCFC